jgi:hypothetical protein
MGTLEGKGQQARAMRGIDCAKASTLAVVERFLSVSKRMDERRVRIDRPGPRCQRLPQLRDEGEDSPLRTSFWVSPDFFAWLCPVLAGTDETGRPVGTTTDVEYVWTLDRASSGEAGRALSSCGKSQDPPPP